MNWTDNYVGKWADRSDRQLIIRRCEGETFRVTLLKDKRPILRPWCDDQPTVDMPATYVDDVLDGDEFAVDLWPPNLGFELILNFQPEYELDEHFRDSLTVCISRHEEHEFLDVHYDLLPLGHFVRAEELKTIDNPTEDRK